MTHFRCHARRAWSLAQRQETPQMTSTCQVPTSNGKKKKKYLIGRLLSAVLWTRLFQAFFRLTSWEIRSNHFCPAKSQPEGALALGPMNLGPPSSPFPLVPFTLPSLTEAQLLRESYPDHSVLTYFYNLLWGNIIITVFHFAKK